MHGLPDAVNILGLLRRHGTTQETRSHAAVGRFTDALIERDLGRVALALARVLNCRRVLHNLARHVDTSH